MVRKKAYLRVMRHLEFNVSSRYGASGVDFTNESRCEEFETVAGSSEFPFSVGENPGTGHCEAGCQVRHAKLLHPAQVRTCSGQRGRAST